MAAGTIAIMRVVMMTVIMVMVVMTIMVVVVMIVVIMGVRRGSFGMPMRPEGGPDEISAHQRDEGVAYAFEESCHVPRSGADRGHKDEQRAHDCDGGQGLDHGAHEGDEDAAAQFILGGQEPGRDHRLAMAWSRGVEHAVAEAQEHQGQSRGKRRLRFHLPNGKGHRAIEASLLVHDPQDRIAPESRRLERAVSIARLDQQLALIDLGCRLTGLLLRLERGGHAERCDAQQQKEGKGARDQPHLEHRTNVGCANMPPKSSSSGGFQSLPLVESIWRVWSSC